MSSINLSTFGAPFLPFGGNPALLPSVYQLTVANAALVVSLALVKQALILDADDTSLDDLLTIYIKAATNFCENYTGRDLLTKTYIGYLDTFPNYNVDYTLYGSVGSYIQIQKSQLLTLNSIKYYTGGVLTTVSSSTYYKSYSKDYSNIYAVAGASWPTDVDVRKQAIQINFDAGYGATGASVPDDLKEGILQHIAQMFENRGDCTSETPSATSDTVIASMKIPEQTKNIYEMYKIRLLTSSTIY
jgi:uncharacterized phiE125 gp8 family phage protein